MGSRNRSRSTRRAKEKAAEPWNHVHLFVWREWLPEESDIWILRPYGCHAHRAHIQKEARARIDYHSSMCFLDRAADSDFSNPLFESVADDLREAEALRRYMWIYNFRLHLRLRFPGATRIRVELLPASRRRFLELLRKAGMEEAYRSFQVEPSPVTEEHRSPEGNGSELFGRLEFDQERRIMWRF